MVDVENKGRTIFETGKVTDSHTRSLTGELSLPRNMECQGQEDDYTKGALLNEYGSDGWNWFLYS